MPIIGIFDRYIFFLNSYSHGFFYILKIYLKKFISNLTRIRFTQTFQCIFVLIRSLTFS
jgi:hypothetical protein